MSVGKTDDSQQNETKLAENGEDMEQGTEGHKLMEQLWHSVQGLIEHAPDDKSLPNKLKDLKSKEELVSALEQAKETNCPLVKDFVSGCGMNWETLCSEMDSNSTSSEYIY